MTSFGGIRRAALVIALLVLAACGPRPQPQSGGGKVTGGTGGTGATGGGTGGTAPPVGTPTGTGVARDIGCLAPTCAFHAGTGTYFTCQSGGAGTCFHFGAACTPEGACMYDPAARSYKQCQRAVEGTCEAWGAACAPANKCMFDARDNLHRTCEAVSGGTCTRFGALCAP